MIDAIFCRRRQTPGGIRRGFTTTEVVVAAGILVSAMAAAVPLTVESGQMMKQARDHDLALDELSNQLDRLLSLEPSELAKSIVDVEASPQLLRLMPSARVTAEKVDDSQGKRLIVSVDWQRPGNPQPLTLTGWIDTHPKVSP